VAPSVGSPLFTRYYEDAKTSGCSSRRSSFSSNNGYLLDSISFRSPRGFGVAPAAPGRWSTGLASPLPVLALEGSQSDLSSSQGTLSCFCPALRPRPVLHALPLAALRFCPRCQDREGSNVEHYFEAQSHGFSTRSIRFVPASLPTTQCSLPAGG
jgi:hypothetical protein